MKHHAARRIPAVAVWLVAVAVLAAGCGQPEGRTDMPPPPMPEPTVNEPPPPTPPPPPPPPPPMTHASDTDGTVTATLAVPTGDKATSVVWLERTGPSPVLVGREFTYRIHVTNLTRATLQNVVVTEDLPDGFDLKGASPKATISGRMLRWTLGNLKGRETRELGVVGTVGSSGPFTGCARVTFDLPELCLGFRAVQPQLEVTKAGPAEAILCDTLTYRIRVANVGTGDAPGVVLTDDLPAGVRTLDGQTKVSVDLGTLAAGTNKEVIIRAKADRTGEFTNAASVKADHGLSASSGPVSTVVRSPELAVTKTAPDMRYVGRPIDYQITVANTGDAEARDTVLTDTLPAGTKLVSVGQNGTASGGQVVWQLGTLAPGAKRTVDLRVTASQIGTITNAASAEAYCASGAASATTDVRGISAVLLECVDEADPIEVGAQETYTITVTNQGSRDDTNIRIECTLPAEQEYVSATGPTQATAAGKRVTFAPLARLAPKARAVFRVVVKGTKAGDVRFGVSLTSDQLTSPVRETESTHIYE